MTTLFDRLPSTLNLPPAKPEHRRSWLLNYLPAMYAGDEFLNRFLLIFEDTLVPIMQMVDNINYYFDPLMTSPELLEWLATWVNLVLDDSWSLEQRRQLIHSATELYSWRGTKRGLTQYIKLYAGVEPEITEYVDGMVLGDETLLGINTTIAGRERHSFTVTMRLNGYSKNELEYKEAAIRRIIQAEKPAHTSYRLIILTNGNHKQSLTQGEF
jgi:phage tail-like protein